MFLQTLQGIEAYAMLISIFTHHQIQKGLVLHQSFVGRNVNTFLELFQH